MWWYFFGESLSTGFFSYLIHDDEKHPITIIQGINEEWWFYSEKNDLAEKKEVMIWIWLEFEILFRQKIKNKLIQMNQKKKIWFEKI